MTNNKSNLKAHQKTSAANRATATPAYVVTTLILGVPLLILFALRSFINEFVDLSAVLGGFCFLVSGLTLAFSWRRLEESGLKKTSAILFTTSFWFFAITESLQSFVIKEILFFSTILVLAILFIATLILAFAWLQRVKKHVSTPLLSMLSLALCASIFVNIQNSNSFTLEQNLNSESYLQAKSNPIFLRNETVSSEELIVSNQHGEEESMEIVSKRHGEEEPMKSEADMPSPSSYPVSSTTPSRYKERESVTLPEEHPPGTTINQPALQADWVETSPRVTPAQPKLNTKGKQLNKKTKHTRKVMAKDAHWNYYGSKGTQNWGYLSPKYETCVKGMEQSPINIPGSWELVNQIRLFSRPAEFHIVDNGHTIQVNFKHGAQTYLAHQRFSMQQLHFHSPSEHLYEGKSFPMEAHFVHKNQLNQLAVVAALIIEGKHSSELDKIWNFLPQDHNNPIKPANTKLDILKFLPKDLKAFTYYGSLTTPPCTEGVRWYLLNNPIEMSKKQIQAFRQRYRMNARPTQPLYHRTRNMAH